MESARFLARAAQGGMGLLILNSARSAFSYQANEKLNVALVGVGGRGRWFVDTIPRIGENVVAMCDVNGHRAAESFRKLPEVPKHRDFRKMLDERDRQIDAVVVATPDHVHAPCSVVAMKRGKHVYCEKPLTHNVVESRVMRTTAKQHQVATQMGNQGTATHAFREGVEIIRSGDLGEVRDVHVWKDSGGPGPRRLPDGSQPVPDLLEWDLWLGPAASRPYHPEWMKWHGWRDFGTCNLGNWAPHTANMAFMGLKIDSLWYADEQQDPPPKIRVEADVSEIQRHSFPKWEIVRFRVPARGDMPPVTIHWYNGGRNPTGRQTVEELMGSKLDWGDAGRKKWDDHAGCLIVGTEGMIHTTSHNSSYRLLPEDKFADYQKPEPTLPRHGSHEREWVRAAKGGPAAMSDFDYAGPLAEILLLGNVATQFDHPLEFDPTACKVANSPEADQALRREYREGWAL
ncbi:MAG: Gfo/Idh/MocA family protein [Planctomycetota bacterium]|jgi:predicted dehydrogenase